MTNTNRFKELFDRIEIIDGVKTIKGSVRLEGHGLKELPDLSDVEVLGSFDCSNNKLKSLKGAPLSVGGWFDCSYNELTTLEGAPQTVDKIFMDHCNKIQFSIHDVKAAMEQRRINDIVKSCTYAEEIAELRNKQRELSKQIDLLEARSISVDRLSKEASALGYKLVKI